MRCWYCVQAPLRPLPSLLHWQDWGREQQLLQRNIWEAGVAPICWSDAEETRRWVGRALGSYHIPLSSLCQVNPSTNVLVPIHKEIPSREKFHPPSHGLFFSATLQLLAWKRSQKTPHTSLTGWQISHTCETHFLLSHMALLLFKIYLHLLSLVNHFVYFFLGSLWPFYQKSFIKFT